MTDWRTDEQKARDARERPWLLAQIAVVAVTSVLGTVMAVVGLIRSLLQ